MLIEATDAVTSIAFPHVSNLTKIDTPTLYVSSFRGIKKEVFINFVAV